MKRINYLIVAMLMAFTMVGCQFDPTYLEDKISSLEESDGKQNERLDGLESRVADIEGKLEGIDFSKFLKGDDLKGYVKVGDTEVLSSIKEAVGNELKADLTGYTKSEIDAKLKAITDITDKLEETYATLEKLNELSTKVTSLETRVSTLENKPTTPNGNGGDGYCGLSADEVTNIKTLLTQWAENNISGVVYSLADYVKTTDLADYVKTENLPSLEGYAKKTDIKDFTSDIATLTNRITTVENMLKADGTVGQKLAELENTISGKADVSLKNTVDTIETWYKANKDKVTNLNLADYLTVANAENTYATKSSVEEVASSLANLKSRVETLETILEIEKNENETISKLKVDYLALKSTVETLATSEALTELSGTIETLKKTVADNKTYLEGKIADSDTNIGAIKTRVDNLENAQATFNSFVTTTTSAIANLTTTVNGKVGSDEITTLIANAITNNTTLVTIEYLEAQNYLTSGSYATIEKVNELETTVNEAKTYIEDINSKYASLVSDRTSFELCPNCFANNGVTGRPTYFYYPYIKFTYADGKTEYMVFGYEGQDPMYTWADTRVRGRYPYIIPDMENDLSFKDLFSTYNESGGLRRFKVLSKLVILFVDSISSDYLPETNN